MKTKILFLCVLLGLLFFGENEAALSKDEADLVSPDGSTSARIAMPKELRLRNAPGRDGAGLCVFTSCNHSAYWHNLKVLWDFRDYMKKYPGGGWPDKVDSFIAKRCKEKKTPVPEYFHVLSNDYKLLSLAVKTGRQVCITYNWSPTGRYSGRRISHMVNLVHAPFDAGGNPRGLWAVLDNNFPEKYEYMTEPQAKKCFAYGGQLWAIVFLGPGPVMQPLPGRSP